MKRALAAFAALAVVLAVAVTGAIVFSAPVRAASQGAGFGTWAPTSMYGWHGSMLVNGVHTYCILPGLPLPTGDTHDHGVRGDAAGLDAQQLTGINLLVSAYGQTDDPVQAAAVGWAVKAIANWDETLHHFGYGGDSLEGAINWTFSSLAPEHNARVQQLARQYYDEARSTSAGSTGGSGSLEFTTDATDSLRGTVTVHTKPEGVTGTVTLDHAVFASSGERARDGVHSGETFDIVADAPTTGTTVTVSGTGQFHGGPLAAVHYFTTGGGQDTAGPAGNLSFDIEGADAAPRATSFVPTIATQVAQRYSAGEPFVDDVTFELAEGIWPRDDAGGYLRVRATAKVFRTEREPSPGDEAPMDAVTTLELTTNAGAGPTTSYRVASADPLPGPGFYTAVWEIDASQQNDAVADALDAGYHWVEPFGERSQTMMVPAISSTAQPAATVGDGMSDDVIVASPVPADGLEVSSAVYRVPDGTAPEDACVDANLLFASNAEHVTAAGTITVVAPEVPDFGTYVWQELARDTAGALVHQGACGLDTETTTATPPSVRTQAAPEAGFGASLTDTAIVSGAVPRTGTTQLRFDLFLARDGVAPEEACTAEALVGSTDTVTVQDAGEYVSPEIRVSASGTYYWVERLTWTPEGGEERSIAEGACGLENETTTVATPTLSTAAVERAATSEPFTDTATVGGMDADADAEVVFFAYRHDRGTPAECTDLLAHTEAVPVDGDGDYVSPELVSETAATVQWVAQLQYRPAPDAEPVILARGECGEAGESTIVEVLAVTGTDRDAAAPLGIWATAGAGLAAIGVGLFARGTVRPRRRTVQASPRRAFRAAQGG